jgi:hypothetical protein
MKLQNTLRRLRGVREIATMQTAHFQKITCMPEQSCHVIEGNVDAFIRERTDLWRRSWIIDPLDEIIEELGRELAEPPQRKNLVRRLDDREVNLIANALQTAADEYNRLSSSMRAVFETRLGDGFEDQANRVRELAEWFADGVTVEIR